MQADLSIIGAWTCGSTPAAFEAGPILQAVQRFRETTHIVRENLHGRLGVAFSGNIAGEGETNGTSTMPLLASLPPLYPEWLGDRSFLETHKVRFPYVTGAMANGIATTRLVITIARSGMLGFFGAAGLRLEQVSKAIDELQDELDGEGLPWGSNLIHSPNEPALERAVVELYLERGVRRVSASAYMALTRHVVRYACSGLTEDAQGNVRRTRYVFAKVSRPEVARRFMSPAPREILDTLVRDGEITTREAELAARVPVAEDFTVESDSGGHTDNQPLTALLPTILSLRDALAAEYGYTRPIRVGAAGGIGTPGAVAAAFSLGAAYVLTGSVNQSAIESGLSDEGKEMLAKADLTDVTMAPAADMFELGVKVQVLSRGTMFGVRAHRLYAVYQSHDSLDAIPPEVRAKLEKELFQQSLDSVWEDTAAFFKRRAPEEVGKAEADAKHKMALCFRWYLGQSSRWAITGDPKRRMDYQIWSGPAMGAFNVWARGSFLEDPARREVVQIARNLLEGAAAVTRAHQLRTYGVPVPATAFQFRPRRLS